MDSPLDGAADFISSMPDEILYHILSFIPTKFAIRTSALSRRWRHVWCETPSLDFFVRPFMVREINQSLSSYRAPKITSFCIYMPRCVPEPQIDRWIEFAVSRNVEKLSLVFDGYYKTNYRLPNFFYLSSSLEKLSIGFYMLIPPGCTVSWKSLRKLTLNSCDLYEDESIANILSGSPILETLRLFSCNIGFKRLDLSKSHCLRRLEINSCQESTEIVAPNIHYFYFCSYIRSSYVDGASCTLVDVSSLAEARFEFGMNSYRPLKGDFLQTMVLKMLAKLQNVERLTLTPIVLQILSLAELLGVLPFPTLKVQTLTIETSFEKSVIPGIARLLHNSPELKKLIAQAQEPSLFLDKYWDEHLDVYLVSQGLSPYQCWKSKYGMFPTSLEYNHILDFKDATLKLMASFIEMVMTNGKTLETFVLGFEYIDKSAKTIWFEELLQMTRTFSNNNNVSIVLKG